MASAVRLERLHTLIRSDIDALPDRPVEAEPEETVSDTEDGGISLDLSAEPPRTSPESEQLESTVKLPPCTHSLGDLVSVSEQFTPIRALAKYPYSFVDRDLMQDIASAFFGQSMWTIINSFSLFPKG
jgi:hypothetical protein